MNIDNRGFVLLTEDNEGNLIEDENKIVISEKTYYLKYLNPQNKFSKGGNSSIFVLYSKVEDTIAEEYAIKISKYSLPNRKTKPEYLRRYGRFINEIKILYELKEKGKGNIVSIVFDDVIQNDKGREFPFYVMEKADTDLKEFIFNNRDLDSQEKVKFCLNIFDAINELHSEGYYHRDIKPDNILLFFDNQMEKTKATWKIGDLGLMTHRDKDYDDLGEKIGPFGWLSPEAANKFLTEKVNLGFECIIDDKSDVFQLGKLFWFIFQGNIPIGQLKIEDFITDIGDKYYVYSMIEEMLTYSKNRRIDMQDLGYLLNELKVSYAV